MLIVNTLTRLFGLFNNLMLFNKDYLFIHIPRTGGKCIKSTIIPFLKKPIYLCQKHIDKKYFNVKDFYLLPNESSHKLAVDTKFFLKENGIDINTLKVITTIRNPYDRIKSLYKFRKFKNKMWTDCSFDTFLKHHINSEARTIFFKPIKDYCTIDNQLLQNINFIRFDHINEDLCKVFNIKEIDASVKKHNEIKTLSEEESKEVFYLKDKKKAVAIINKWEEWAINQGLVKAVTEKDLSN